MIAAFFPCDGTEVCGIADANKAGLRQGRHCFIHRVEVTATIDDGFFDPVVNSDNKCPHIILHSWIDVEVALP